MVAYSFMDRFAAPILAGTKRQTIRKPRAKARHARPGDRVTLYTGLRTKAVRRLGVATCIAADLVWLNFQRNMVTVRHDLGARPIIGWPELDAFAQADGLEDWAAFKATFHALHGADLVEFHGVMIQWGDLR